MKATKTVFPWDRDALEQEWLKLTARESVDFFLARTLLLKIYPPFLDDWARWVAPLIDGDLNPSPLFGDGGGALIMQLYWHVWVKHNRGVLMNDFESRAPSAAVTEVVSERDVEQFFNLSPEMKYLKVNFAQTKTDILAEVEMICRDQQKRIESIVLAAGREFGEEDVEPLLLKMPKNKGFATNDWKILRLYTDGSSFEKVGRHLYNDEFGKGNVIHSRLKNIVALLDLRGKHDAWLERAKNVTCP